MFREGLINTLRSLIPRGGRSCAEDASKESKSAFGRGGEHWITTKTGAHILINGSDSKPEKVYAPKHSFREKQLMKVFYAPAKGTYKWDTKGIVRLGRKKDIAAYTVGDFKGKCVIYCHGQGESAVSSAFLFRELADKSGASFISPDYRGVGLSEGDFSENGIYEAVNEAYDYLVRYKKVKPKDIVVLGYSLGTGAATQLAGTREVGGCILQTPFYSAEEQIKHILKNNPGYNLVPGIPKKTKICQSFRNAEKIKAPTLVFHGTADRIVPFAQGRAVYDIIGSKDKEMVAVNGGDHTTFQSVMGWGNYTNRVANFIRKI